MYIKIKVEQTKFPNNGETEQTKTYDEWTEQWSSVRAMTEFYSKELNWTYILHFKPWEEEKIQAKANPEDGDILCKIIGIAVDENGNTLYGGNCNEIKFDLAERWLSDIAKEFIMKMSARRYYHG